jgi:hypothetical protein
MLQRDAEGIITATIWVFGSLIAFYIYIKAVPILTPKADPTFTWFVAFLIIIVLGIFVPLVKLQKIYDTVYEDMI